MADASSRGTLNPLPRNSMPFVPASKKGGAVATLNLAVFGFFAWLAQVEKFSTERKIFGQKVKTICCFQNKFCN